MVQERIGDYNRFKELRFVDHPGLKSDCGWVGCIKVDAETSAVYLIKTRRSNWVQRTKPLCKVHLEAFKNEYGVE